MNLRNRIPQPTPCLAAPVVLGGMLIMATGCSSGSTMSASDRADIAAKKAAAETERVITNLDRAYVIGPTAASELNYRIVWQYEGANQRSLKAMGLRGDSVYTLDQENFLTRINISDGQKRWRTQAAEPVLDVISLNVIDDRIFLTAGSQMLVFDASNGTQLAKWNLERVAGTHPVEHNGFLIYGSRGGDLVWLSRTIGFLDRAYHISPTFRVPPVIRGNAIATVGVQGEVALLNADTATQYWSKMLLNPVVSRPVIGEELVYVAGQDQYVWGLDLGNGRATWKYFTGAPLTASPTLHEGHLYQQEPGTGLICLSAVPIDLPGGELLWSNEKVTGNVILARRGELFAWDAGTHRLVVLDDARGLTRTRLDLPQAQYLVAGGDKGEDIFAASPDGRVVRLTPRN